jgi:hypothetical protein
MIESLATELAATLGAGPAELQQPGVPMFRELPLVPLTVDLGSMLPEDVAFVQTSPTALAWITRACIQRGFSNLLKTKSSNETILQSIIRP